MFSSQWGRSIRELHPAANPPKTMLLAARGLRLGLCSSDSQGNGILSLDLGSCAQIHPSRITAEVLMVLVEFPSDPRSLG